jgi:hypothetical protein
MNATSKPPRDHHIVPRFHLEGFARPDPGMRNPTIWVYEKDNPPRPSTPTHEARERDYYAIKEGAQPDYRFEFLLSNIEALAAPIFRKLEDRKYFFNPDERIFMAYFAGLLFARVRPLRKHLNRMYKKAVYKIGRDLAQNREQFETACREVQALLGKEFEIESLREFALSGNYAIKKMPTTFNLQYVVKTSLEIGDILLSKKWILLRSHSGQSFVTSDNPICSVLPVDGGRAMFGVGFKRTGVEIVFPLRLDACLYLHDGEHEGIVDPEPALINSCNLAIMKMAERNLYADRQSQNLHQRFQKVGCTCVYEKTAFVPESEGIP